MRPSARSSTVISHPSAPSSRRPLHLSKFAKLLTNKYYIGVVTYRGVEYPGKHPPLVSVETFNRVQEVLRQHDYAAEHRRVNHHYLKGSLFALDPRNPDAARHFCASSREIISQVLHREAPDDRVHRALPDSPTTPEGKPTRRARVQYFLHQKGLQDPDLENFVEKDLDNVVTLFDVFNEGTHGKAGAFSLGQLVVIKRRVEDAIRFLHRIIR